MKVLAFDANSIVNRAFYGVRLLSTREGTYTNAVYGFFNIVYKLIEEQKPDAVAFAFDLHAPTFRHKMYEQYKGTRKGMPEELRQQMPLVKELLRQNGACSFQMDCGHRVVQLPGHGITTRYGCVMGKATVTPLTEEEKPQAMRLLIDRYLPGAPGCPPQTMARTAMWRLEVADWSAKENKD